MDGLWDIFGDLRKPGDGPCWKERLAFATWFCTYSGYTTDPVHLPLPRITPLVHEYALSFLLNIS
jgi:hypothetical protein